MKWHNPARRDARELAARDRRQRERTREYAAGGVRVCTLERDVRFVRSKVERDRLQGTASMPLAYDQSAGCHMPLAPEVYTATGRRTNRGRVIYLRWCNYRSRDEESFMDPNQIVYVLPREEHHTDPRHVRDEEEI